MPKIATKDNPALPPPLAPPDEEAVGAAVALIDALSDQDLSRFQFKSPENEFTAAVLRSQVRSRSLDHFQVPADANLSVLMFL